MSMILADPLDPSAHKNPPSSGRPRRRWELWRSPDGQPAWARPALLAIAAVAAALYAWNITQAGLAPFYSVAVKSMSESWKAFFYGALDPSATVTIDKLAGSFLPQALSARIFGFHAWSVALPQVIEGVISVLAMYRVVRRWAGVVPGLLAAALFTLTPIAASMFGHSMEDGALTMCLVLAADAYQRAVSEGRFRSLLMAGVWIGLGFQAKMLQAWMVLPALAVGYLVTAPTPLRRRLAHLGAAVVIMLAVSMSWIALYTFTPAADRPYVDGSTDNSAIAMVFGYNGVERFGVSFAGAVSSGPGVTSGTAGGFGGAGAARSAATSTESGTGGTTGAGVGGPGAGGAGSPGAGTAVAPGAGTGAVPSGAPGQASNSTATSGSGTPGTGGGPGGGGGGGGWRRLRDRLDQAARQRVRHADRLAVPPCFACPRLRRGVDPPGPPDPARRAGPGRVRDVGHLAGHVRPDLQQDEHDPAHRLHVLPRAAARGAVSRRDRHVLAGLPRRKAGGAGCCRSRSRPR